MKKTILITLAVGGALALLLAILLFLGPTYTANWDTEPVRINIPQDCTYDDLRDTLDAHEVVIRKTPAAIVFDLEARAVGLTKHVRPGSYLVPRNMEMHAFVRKLRNGQQDPIRLTIGKFRTPGQLNHYLDTKLMHNDFQVPLDSFHLVLQDTYEVYWTITPEQFMQRMEKESAAYWQQTVDSGECVVGSTCPRMLSTTHYPLPTINYPLPTTRDVVILASIVEEETNNAAEKPLIASVYLNRLKRGMPLQADPTVKYAVGDFTLRRILNRHLATESPFNTYLHTGLPPAPICLPSKATIRAVLNAPQTDYLYFCASDRMDGTHRFAATLAEHNRNAAAFHRALDTHGIR